MKNETVLVTGASGFIGRVVCLFLLKRGYSVRAVTSSSAKKSELYAYLQAGLTNCDRSNLGGKGFHKNEISKQLLDIVRTPLPNSANAWDRVCSGVDVIIHLAGRAHIIHETTDDALSAFRKVNRDISVSLANSAANTGVKRIVYVSSIGVLGDSTDGQPFSETDLPCPYDAYTRSKLEAEQALRRISEESNLEVVIVRPPLVYGPNVKGNFLRLLKLVDKGLPLPLSSIHNVRSMIGVENLADILTVCAFHPLANGHVFLVSDDVGWSTAQLIRRLAHHMKRPARLFPVPLAVLMFAGYLTRQSKAINGLCSSLEIDTSKTRDYFGWSPPLSPDEGLRHSVEWYLSHRND